MRKLVLAAVAALLATAMPGMASAMTNAAIGVSFGDYDVSSSNVDMLGFNGAFSDDIGNGMTLQVEGAHDSVDAGPVDIAVSYGAISLGTRNDQYAVYGFVGRNDLIFSGNSVGVGGQAFFSQAMLNGSVAYKDHDGLIDASVTNFHVDATWYVNDNVGVTGELAHTEFEIFSNEIDWNTYGVGVSFRPDDSPVTIELRYQNRDFDGGDVDTFRVSLTIDLGGPRTLQEYGQTGPTFNGASSLHDEVRVLPVLF